MSLTNLSADELSTAIHARTVSCREVMQAYLARIQRLNPIFNAIVNLADEAQLLHHADQRDAELARGESRGWMHGMPQAMKDASPAAGFPTTLGCILLKDNVAKADSVMTARMKAAGCIVVGKINVPEFGLGSHTFNDVIKPEAQWEHDQGVNLSFTDFMRASEVRTAFHTHLVAMFERFDALALPVAQVWPFDVRERWPQQIAGRAMDTYHRWMEVTTYATFAGLPRSACRRASTPRAACRWGCN